MALPHRVRMACEEAAEAGVDLWVPDDFNQIYRILMAVQKRSHYRGMQTSAAQMMRSFLTLQKDWTLGRVFVTRDSTGRPRAVLAATAMPYWWAHQGHGPQYATEMIFVSTLRDSGLKLLRALELWAWTLPRVKKIEMDISSDIHPERTSELYLDAGFKQTGTIFVKDRPEDT